MSLDLPALAAAVTAHGDVVRVLVMRTMGSTPRERDTSMLLWLGGQQGTIGGGTLEWEAITRARIMLREGRMREVETLPLGPALGQCCGGSVTILLERFTPEVLPEALPWARPLDPDRARSPRVDKALAAWEAGAPSDEIDGWVIEGPPLPGHPVWVWGAGHVGHALVEVLAVLPGVAITWADVAPDRFPPLSARAAPNVTVLPATDLPRLATHAPPRAEHFILTMSHDIDLALCHALLQHGFSACGLIGSETKRKRFQSRLGKLGHSREEIARIQCPIGDPTLGKHPQAIAVSVAAALLKRESATAGGTGPDE